MLDIFYLFALIFASPLLFYKSLRRGKYRDGWGQKFLGLSPNLPSVSVDKKRIWFHAVSVGEINMLKPIVAHMRAEYPDWEFVVSSTTKTGLEIAKELFADQTTVFYCPFDFSWAVKRAMRRIKPDMLVLVELELWPNLIKFASKSGAKVAIVSARMYDGSFKKYSLVKIFWAPTFRRIDLIAAQDDVAADYFKRLSPVPEHVCAVGSIKFDGVKTDRNNPATQALAKLVGIRESDVVFLAGSAHYPEEKGALEVYRRLCRDYPALKLIVVPRHKERFEEVAKMLDASEFSWTRRSAIAEPIDPDSEASRVVLVDVLGELGVWWGLANIAFVGGSWGARTGHNMLEPAGYGAAVSFGPNTKNFQSIVDALLRENAAKVVADVDEMEAFVKKCLDDPDYARNMGAAARELTIKNAGTTRRTLEELARLFEA